MYLALYRKYRPKTFEDVVSQPHITTTLKNEIMTGKTAHAYLFTGSRGTGKTTCAKILSMAVNCEHPVNGNPCMECETCRNIDQGATLDVVEIDAASNNGVDDVRQLREEAVYSPSQCKYRVYIIDEAHMLSAGAFNALLKIMEEPPPHVKFILATTEVHKVPVTILSRCQRFDFRRIRTEDIEARLLAGVAGNDDLFALTDCIIKEDASGALCVIDKLYHAAKDLQVLLNELCSHFRDMMLIQTMKNPGRMLSLIPEEERRTREQANALPLSAVLSALSEMRDTLDKMGRSADKRLLIELCMIKLCTPSLRVEQADLISRIERLENRLKSGNVSVPSANVQTGGAPSSASGITQSVKTEERETAQESKGALHISGATAPSSAADMSMSPTPAVVAENIVQIEPLGSWIDVLSELSRTNAPLFGMLQNTRAFTKGGLLFIDGGSPLLAQMLKKEGNASKLLDAVEIKTGVRYQLRVKRAKKEQAQADPLASLLDKARENGIAVLED